MNYFEEIKLGMKEHIDSISSISLQDLTPTSRKKIENHLNSTLEVNIVVDNEDPQKMKKVIEYLEQEGRSFGWSFPENKKEELCEDSFWNLKNKLKKLIGGMTVNERVYYFGYHTEFENIPPNDKSAREEIFLKLFVLG
jgi:hypothetical protein